MKQQIHVYLHKNYTLLNVDGNWIEKKTQAAFEGIKRYKGILVFYYVLFFEI